MTPVYICDYIRTPIGRFGGALSAVRPDDLAALPLRALVSRNPGVEWDRVDDVIFGCANQAGEDNRNVARMAALLAGLPVGVPLLHVWNKLDQRPEAVVPPDALALSARQGSGLLAWADSASTRVCSRHPLAKAAATR